MRLRDISMLTMAISTAVSSPMLGAQGSDPDWPCIQRKVPELSMAQIWTGPELPSDAAGWSKDAKLSILVEELAARRLPLHDAQERILAYRNQLPPDEAPRRIGMLVQGLFDKMNAERAHVMAGIGRYAHRQRDMAAYLRRESADLDALRAKADADAADLAVRNERLLFQIRIYQERVKSLTFVCEVPTLIEQRLYALVKMLADAPAAR